MSKIIDQVRVRCKTFVRGCEISRSLNRTSSMNDGLRNYQANGGKRGKITGFSTHSRRLLREYLASARPAKSGEYAVLGFCLTIPNSLGTLDNVQASRFADIFRKSFVTWYHSFIKHFHDVGLIWRVELQQSRMPHVHLVAYVPLDDLAMQRMPDGSLVEDWEAVITRYTPPPRLAGYRSNWKPVKIKWTYKGLPCTVPNICFIARKLWLKQLEKVNLNTSAASVRSVDCQIMKSDNSVHYLCDHQTKQKQAQLGWQGRQWAIVNGSALVFDESAPLELSSHEAGRYSRIFSRIEAERMGRLRRFSRFQIREAASNLRLCYCVDRVKSKLPPKFLSLLRVPIGELANCAERPTIETLRNYSRIDYRPIARPIWHGVGVPRLSEMTQWELVKTIKDGEFEPGEDSLLVFHSRLLSLLSRPKVQTLLPF